VYPAAGSRRCFTATRIRSDPGGAWQQLALSVEFSVLPNANPQLRDER
jgi:hypothetical protein